MAWWETEPAPADERSRFKYDVAKARSRRLAVAAQAPAPPEQQTAAASLPPTQTAVQGGAFAQPTTPVAIPYSQQPVAPQVPQQIAMPPGVQDERLADLAPITPREAIYTPKAQILREQVTGMIPKPWRDTPFHEWVTRGTIGASHRLTEAFEKPTAKGTEEPSWEEVYPSAELRQAVAKAAPGEFPVAELPKKPSWIKRGWSKLERETGWADPVTRGLRTFGAFLNEPAQFAKQHIMGSVVSMHPEAEGLSEEQLYPLSESAGSLLFGPLLDALSAPDEDSDSIADLLGRLHDVAFPPGAELGQGLGPQYIGKVLTRVKEGEDSREVAADIYDPWAEALLEAAVDPWNALDVLEIASVTKFLGKFGRGKQLVTAAEQAVLDPKFSKQAGKLATGYERLHDRQAAAAAAGLADTAKKAGVELSPEQLGIIEKGWRGTVGLTPGSLADRDLNQTFKAGTVIFSDVKSGDEAMELAKRLVNDPDGLAVTHGKNVQGQLGQKAQKVYAEILDDIPNFKSVKEEVFNPAHFLLELEDAARPAVEAIHGVKPPNKYQQVARHAKGIMSELYLSAISSPRYVISNFLVDNFTTSWSGISPLNRMSDVENWMERFGPTTLRAGGKDMREAIHGFRGRSNLPDWTGFLKRWSEKSMYETRHGKFRDIPVGEEARYLSGLKDQIEKFWNANAYKHMPDLPDELVQHLGPDLADDIRHAVSGGLNDDERRRALFRILDAQSPGEGIPYRKLLTPQEIDSIPREVHQHLDDEFSKLTTDSPVDEMERIIREAWDKVADDVAQRLDDLGDLPPSVLDSLADEEDLLDDVVENLTEAVERSGDPSLADEIPEIVEKKKAMADELAAAIEEATETAIEVGNQDGMEIMIAATRDTDDLLKANRKRLGKLRFDVVEDYRANPYNAKALWTEYFRRVDAGWTAHAMERHKRMVEATEQIRRLGEGESLADILGKTQREVAEMRLRDVGDLPPEVKDYIPASVLEDDEGKFEKFLTHRQATIDRARADAWRVGVGVDPGDYRAVLDTWNATGYDVDLIGRQAAGRVTKARVKAMAKADAVFAAGVKDASTQAKAIWEKYYAARNAIWDEYFDVAERRWMLAEHDLQVQEYFKHTPPEPPPPKAMPTESGDRELAEGALRKAPADRTPEEVAALDRWTAKGAEPQVPEEPPVPEEPIILEESVAPPALQELHERLWATAEPWFHKSELLIDANMADQATVEQIRSILAKGGVNESDLEWTGIAGWLDTQEGTLTKEEVLSFLRGEQTTTFEQGQSLLQKAQETNDLQKAAGQPGATGTRPVGAEMMVAGEQDTQDALESLRQGLNDNWDQWQPKVADDAARRGLDDWLTKDVKPVMNDLRATAVEYGEGRVDDSLLDYSRRRGFDVALSYAVPYNYWYTRTGYNWARRFSRRPAVLAHYLRYLDASKKMNEAAGRRKRFETKRPYSAEWLPEDWMGDELYVDPLRAMLPFANIGGYNWDDPDDSSRGLRRVMDTFGRVGFRLFPWVEMPYQAGVVARGAEALGVPKEEAQELYAPKREGEFGFMLPQTGIVKGATAFAGIGPPGGVNIEAPFRRIVGLPESEAWEPYRVTRMLANMSTEAAADPTLARHVLNAQELAERWGEQKQHGRPWEPGNVIADTTARELNWTPEDLAQAQAQLREGVNRAAKERAISTASSLYTAMPASIEPVGEATQIELQRRAGEKLWSPEQPGGTRTAYDQYRRDYPSIYARQAQYGTIPGAEEVEGFTPGQRGSWLARKEATEEINARYDAEMDVPGLSEKEKKAITGARYDELDQVREQYPLPDMPDDMPAVKYGSSPEEAWDQLVEAELWDIKDSKPKPEGFMDGLQVRWTEYGDAVDEWEKSLPAAFGFGAVEGGKYAGMDPHQAYFLMWPKTTDTPDASEEETEEAKSGYAATSGRTWYNKQAPRPYYRSAGRRRAPIWTPRRTTYGGPFRG